MADKEDVVELSFYTIHDGVTRLTNLYRVSEEIGNSVMEKFSLFHSGDPQIIGVAKPLVSFLTADGKKKVSIDLRWFAFMVMEIPAPKGGEVKAKGDNKLTKKKEEKDGAN